MVGEYRQQFVARDTLPPRNLRLYLSNDNSEINPATVLTRGREYSFTVTAEDNYTASEDFTYSYRLSTAFDAPQTGEIAIRRQSFSGLVRVGFDYFETRFTIRDRAGFSLFNNVRIALRDPVVELESFTTNPVEPEESTRVSLFYDLQGDIDLVTSAEMSVAQIQNGQPTDVYGNYNQSAGTVSGSFLNPKVRDILQDGAPVQPVEMNGRLLINYGIGFDALIEQPYTLFLDKTPPTLSIVSPENGDFIAIGDRTDVLIKAFDKYGIETVEVSKNNGEYEVLENPTRYSFTATIDDFATGITINARATDPNGNVSPCRFYSALSL